MARIEPAVDYSTILRMKGILDYSTWKGVNYVRSWPRKSSHKRSAGEIAGSLRFTQATKSWRDQAPEVQNFYRLLVKGTTERPLDLWTASFTKLAGLWRHNESPIINQQFSDVPAISLVQAGLNLAQTENRVTIGFSPSLYYFTLWFVRHRPSASYFKRVYRGRLCSGLASLSFSSLGPLGVFPAAPSTTVTWPAFGPIAPITVAVVVQTLGPVPPERRAAAPFFMFTFLGTDDQFQAPRQHIGDWTFP